MTADRQPLVVVGDVLLDQDVSGTATRLAPDAPVPVVEVSGEHSRPGGAGLAAALAAREGRDVVLVCALGSDEASEAVRAMLPAGVRLVEIPFEGALPVKTRVLVEGRPLVRVDRGGGTPGPPGAGVRAALAGARAVLVADYGQGTAAAVRGALAEAARRLPLVWDPHPRGPRPVPGARLVTPNGREARHFLREDRPGDAAVPAEGDDSLRAHRTRGALLAERWLAGSVAVTLGERGAVLTRADSDDALYVPVAGCGEGDPCGAGDCFAATAAGVLADGGLPEEAVGRAAEAAAAFVTGGGLRAEGPGAGGPRATRTPPAGRAGAGGAGDVGHAGDPWALVDAVRARGGTVVAAGGCFDLLHAGHVQFLENARRTGDCLIVCVNSDASIRRLKGPGRPLNPAADRMRVLAGLGCVDAVLEFGEDTPEALLRRLRPDVWVKGGDYRVDDLPEAAALREWGGQTLVLPYLDGRSTTELARRAAFARP
ncbi:D-glycero-beta-D-manno-heptose 1-phosphate adenylyltransferase [Streptomyces hoynatensis]|uniref:D-glycero-beta-D-manno-heptose 1-phosphate adenylyltransferase n=1 Tax=Streptomyces hoynatensis TaxID=1141874 RepID=A0A3A9YVM4_9ACTN|nr:D-glycero-beta-D-manno-heptose 1-phosphate adenylyltransferase [Streptomyces hoynatensis]RKN40092.1 D-glycero-beta-D-manno-heptose 1-phosphate adenylyltransferase [Streptomyces hoynatensis]